VKIDLTDVLFWSNMCSLWNQGFMTGRDPSRFRIHTALNGHWDLNAKYNQSNFLPTEVLTVTKLLQTNGYATGHYGKVPYSFSCNHLPSSLTLPLPRFCSFFSPSLSQWHLGSGPASKNQSEGSAPVPTEYGIDESCTFNSNDPCITDHQTANTSVDIVAKAIRCAVSLCVYSPLRPSRGLLLSAVQLFLINALTYSCLCACFCLSRSPQSDHQTTQTNLRVQYIRWIRRLSV
jgi:hypothetical protein